MSSRTYDRFLDAWAATEGHGIAFDTPGFGLSDGPVEPPEIADYARAMLAGLDALGLTGPVDLVGYHTGSMIACQLAAVAPTRVRRLVLVSAPIFDAAERTALAAHYGPELPSADGRHLAERWRAFAHHFAAGGCSLDQIVDAFLNDCSVVPTDGGAIAPRSGLHPTCGCLKSASGCW